ncbi:MAG: hypothetical protein HY567_04505 [Candidatus Kerfeldbacteria bacterium]|nr:hypothetical protein [Candidatus Kerfeldbacteria bacterium]
MAQRALVQEVETLDPAKLDPTFLPDPTGPKLLGQPFPNCHGPFAPKGDLAHYIVTMCHDAGLRRITVPAIIGHRTERMVWGKPPRRSRATIRRPDVLAMYVQLRNGQCPRLFLEIAAACGYVVPSRQTELKLGDS